MPTVAVASVLAVIGDPRATAAHASLSREETAGWLAVGRANGVFARCDAGNEALDVLLLQDRVAMIFAGTVERVDREGSATAVTFRGERAWKGPVAQRATIYGRATFEHGARYVVVAHRLSPAERATSDCQTATEPSARIPVETAAGALAAMNRDSAG